VPVPVPNRYSLSLMKREMELLVAEYGLSLPIHALITSENDRRKRDDLVCHFEATGRVSCIVPIHEGLAVSSPELCFLQLARSSTLQELIFYGFRLCSTYRFNEFSPTGMEPIEPLMTISSAKALLTRLSRCHGSALARKALSLVIENAASPKEIEAAMRLSLPYNLGGYHLNDLELNPSITLDKAGQAALGRPTLKPDFLWRSAKVLAEYQSDLTHLDLEQHAFDLKRMNVFVRMGYKQISINSEHLSSIPRMDALAKDIAKLSGKYIRPSLADYPSRQLALVHCIQRMNDERL